MLACAALVTALGLQFAAPAFAPDAPAVVGLAARKPRGVTAPLAVDHPDILRRPLFAPDRQPAAEGAAGAPAGSSLDDYAAVGAVTGRSIAVAVLAAPGVPSKSVRLGEEVGGWRLVSVQRGKVSFERDGAVRTLVIGAAAGAPAREAAQGSDDNSASGDGE